MRAQPGDWLVVEQANTEREARRGRIEEVSLPDGAPPYRVRWLDTGRQALVFPGPDAHVVIAGELEDRNSRAADRAAHVQREILEHRRRS
ncbi:DUF1918 domain-containing protein [Actinophytocola gossypii]|uniref:DUF1918 domain-containing protein n=1 Tax=Actinophytocola gossypii TaxID=2812003 RepID=A0ABT2JJ84_9PSEU|nr:DUF1918 domain-containing protein [Actinophytocola gossypii]MCT2587931.1 DUF1918 domain-containing protein [Actinophytocola gossypii]